MSSEDRRKSEALEAGAKRAFDESVEHIDAHTRSRLAHARTRALESLEAPRVSWHASWRVWAPAGAAAAAMLAAGLVALDVEREDPASRPDSVALDDLELLLEADELEMLEELEFYAWLEEQPEFSRNGSGDGPG